MTRAVSRKHAMIFAVSLFLIGIAIITYLNAWWPGLMLVVGIPMALRQHLLERDHDMWVTLFVFVGAYVTVQFDVAWEIVLPVLFALGGIYIIFREYLDSTEETIEEEDEDLNEEIEEDQHKKDQ